jgi:hypothetical protein
MPTTLFLEQAQQVTVLNIVSSKDISMQEIPTEYLDQDLDQADAVVQVAAQCAACSQVVAV